eukprot:5061133-Pleurochrysis_carterae.AAC.1
MKLACAPHAIRDHVAYTVWLLVKRAIARWRRATSAVVRTATVSEIDTRLCFVIFLAPWLNMIVGVLGHAGRVSAPGPLRCCHPSCKHKSPAVRNISLTVHTKNHLLDSPPHPMKVVCDQETDSLLRTRELAFGTHVVQ